MMTNPASDNWTFVWRLVLVFLVVAAAAFLWQITAALLLAFGGILLAVILRGAADTLVAPYTGLRPGWALFATIVAILVFLGLLGWLLGSRIVAQFGQLSELMPQGLQHLRDSVSQVPFGERLAGRLQDWISSGSAAESAIARVVSGVSAVVGVLIDIIIIVFLGVYLAAQPELYRSGVAMLAPPHRRREVEAVMTSTGEALRLWALGQLVSMTVVGVLTGLGLWLVGVPAPLALGLLAFLLEFIPYFGPWLAAIPGILIAFTQGGSAALYAALVYLIVQQLESYVVMPIVQRRAASLPPALGIIAVVAFGLAFGVFGLLFAVPLTITLMVLVKLLYVEDALGTRTKVPGRSGPR